MPVGNATGNREFYKIQLRLRPGMNVIMAMTRYGSMMIIAGGIFLAFRTHAAPLSLKEYVRMALERNPQQKIAASQVASKRAYVEISRSNLLPQVNGTASLNRSESWSPTNRLSASSAAVSGSMSVIDANYFNAGVNGNIVLYDFGAGRFQYKASGQALEAARYDSQSSMATLALNARTAYFGYLLSQRLLDVSEDALKQANVHLNQALILFQVGKLAKIAITKSRVDVANAEVSVIHAKNALDLARVQMEVVAGLPLADPLELTDSLAALEDSVTVDQATAAAMLKRTEFLALQAGIESARWQLKSARAVFLPLLKANGSLGWAAHDNASLRSSDFANSPNWNVGGELSVPIYQGGRLRALARQAEASLQLSQAQLEALKLTVIQQIRQYFLQEKEALRRIAATKTLIEQAEESLNLSQERFRAGVAFSIEITDAEATLANARQSHAQAQYDYHMAHANLLLAAGSLTE
jgi:outer membrane protein